MAKTKSEIIPCQWIAQKDAFSRFASHTGGTQSAKHIKPLHWYIASRLVLEGGFDPSHITPRPPFSIDSSSRRGANVLHYDPNEATGNEKTILGGLKTKNVDVVVTNPELGPVLAISCKGATKAFRNLTNRMEETIGECTNLHITYPALVLGYFAIIRANRTLEDAREAPEIEPEDSLEAKDDIVGELPTATSEDVIEVNDIAVLKNETVADGVFRFYSALSEMTGRRGIRNEISRYEAITLVMIEPKGKNAGSVFPNFPDANSPLHLSKFFDALYRRYEERFVLGAPLLADRRVTTRLEWSPMSPIFTRSTLDAAQWPSLDFTPRLGNK